jgi:hypothetical protein
MKKVLLTTHIPNDKTAWSKARVDVAAILAEKGYESVYLPELKKWHKYLPFFMALKRNLTKEGHILIEYPFHERKRAYLLYLFRFLTRVPMYALIHDLNSIRFQTPHAREISILKLFDGVISHNPSMTKWLHERGIRGRTVDLKVFDYRLQENKRYHLEHLTSPVKIVYAGNLSYKKATYIYSKEFDGFRNVEISVFGQYFEPERISNSIIRYKGVFDPNHPVLDAKYHFGLIWEGTSIDTCDGEYGHYLKYNNPHKFSLYLSLGLPIIIWEKAALASFIRENGIGITIGSLKEIQSIGEKLTDEAYMKMTQSINEVSKAVQNGSYLKEAVEKLTIQQ